MLRRRVGLLSVLALVAVVALSVTSARSAAGDEGARRAVEPFADALATDDGVVAAARLLEPVRAGRGTHVFRARVALHPWTAFAPVALCVTYSPTAVANADAGVSDGMGMDDAQRGVDTDL